MWDAYELEIPAARAAMVRASHHLEWALALTPVELTAVWDSTAGRAFSYHLAQSRCKLLELHRQVLAELQQIEP